METINISFEIRKTLKENQLDFTTLCDLDFRITRHELNSSSIHHIKSLIITQLENINPIDIDDLPA